MKWLWMPVAASLAVLPAGCEQPQLRGAVPSREQAQQLRETLAQSTDTPDQTMSGSAEQRTGWATLRGTIKVTGSVAPPVALQISKDVEVCGPGGSPVFSQQVLVDATSGGLANVALYAQGLSGDNVHPDAAGGKTDEVIFDQKKCIFLSHVALMQATQKLKILNSDPVAHNTKIDTKRAKSINESIPPGGSAFYVPGKSEKEPAPVSCSIHPWMKAYLLPLDNSYASVTDTQGTFEIANLPAGVDVVLQAWHEKTGKKLGDISVDGQASWKRGKLEFTGNNRLADGETRELTLVVPAAALQ
ncbi:MAG: hypothetical protein GTO53_07975 [Planctomycetales bacterium]|nr:hypothetical protein [Planctomycetales bacterium]NIM09073.1 hypothetical protein [Planctomycetales bacterium]NIN08531.1 hypothetical protein [Planctomycetales bacterium]NIN77665.1 hypothetical protein [Planctomycetales bacterium]NIO34831.1 hypothetical protein [Planctomycetales bacterium]